MSLTMQCCAQETDGLYEAMERAVTRSEVHFVSFILYLQNQVFGFIYEILEF